MVEATAAERTTRALRHKTVPDARHKDFQVGDQVEFHIPVHPDARPTKHVEGWIGPAKVVDLTDITRGQIGIKYRNIYRQVDAAKVRKWFGFFMQDAHPMASFYFSKARSLVQEYVGSLRESVTLGLTNAGKSWTWTKETHKRQRIYEATLHLAKVVWHLDDIVAVRMGPAKNTVPSAPGFDHAHMVVWSGNSFEGATHINFDPSQGYSFADLHVFFSRSCLGRP